MLPTGSDGFAEMGKVHHLEVQNCIVLLEEYVSGRNWVSLTR